MELATAGEDWGIVGLGLLALRRRHGGPALSGQDYLYTLIEKGGASRRPTSSVRSPGRPQRPTITMAPSRSSSPRRPTSILSLTVTEAGYTQTSPTFERIAAALAVRREEAGGPLTILSCDNLPGNGDAARAATLAAAERLDGGLAALGHRALLVSQLDG
jgi:mannitol-1-phosphate/altronate dehydrogenase